MYLVNLPEWFRVELPLLSGDKLVLKSWRLDDDCGSFRSRVSWYIYIYMHTHSLVYGLLDSVKAKQCLIHLNGIICFYTNGAARRRLLGVCWFVCVFAYGCVWNYYSVVCVSITTTRRPKAATLRGQKTSTRAICVYVFVVV